MKTTICALLAILAVSIPADAQSTLQQRRRLNPYPTAQRLLREYQPTDDELLIEEIRLARCDAEAQRRRDDQRAFQERIILEQRLAQIERARQMEAQRRSIEAITRRPIIAR